ncbi:MAG: hypothetical protein ABTQ34_08360 [Bdellovibrionales bacterium]
MTGTFAPACRRQICAAILGLLLGSMTVSAQANELPLASRSAMTGITFEDRPLALPVQINFRMAMLSASTELGRSCGKMEAYGWRMGSTEQPRLDQIFTTTIEYMRHQGYFIQSEAPAAVSRDITIFTADRLNQHYIFMWSAGEIGLVMVICESSPPLTGRAVMTAGRGQTHQKSLMAQDVIQSAPTGKNEPMKGAFTPVGIWKGEYTCLPQGHTGATLQISRMKGEDFEGEFHFYPTPRNAAMPEGRYEVYGQYDQKSHCILINPGKWLQQPKDFSNSVMVGGFDVATRTFSAYFQGVNGCTSYEAKYLSTPARGNGGVKASTGKKKRADIQQSKPATPTAQGRKSQKKSKGPEDSLKSIKPVIIGGPGDQGKATQVPIPSTPQKIDRDFFFALNGDEESRRPYAKLEEGEYNRPYAKLEEETPLYATVSDEKIPQDKTPATQFYILPGQIKAAAKSQQSQDEEQMQPQNDSGSTMRKFLVRKSRQPQKVTQEPTEEPQEASPYYTPTPSSALSSEKSGESSSAPTFAAPQGKNGKSSEQSPELPSNSEGEKPQSALEPTLLVGKAFRLASSGAWISPKAPDAPGPSVISPVAPSAPAVAKAPPATVSKRVAPNASEPSYVSSPAPRNYVAPEAPEPSVIIPPSDADPKPTFAHAPSTINPRAPAAPEPEYVPDVGARP